MKELKIFLADRFEFRVNLLRQQTEWRRKADAGQPATSFRPLDEMALNTIYIDALSADIDCTYKQLKCLLFSGHQPSYHPVYDYMAGLPQWDGRDRIAGLAHRVSRSEEWTMVFHRWMLALAAQWMGRPMQAANSMVPVLVSERQGLRKSTFCRMLVPPELGSYYLDRLDFTQAGEYDRMMAQFCLINLDEMDSYTPRAMAKFKAATQMQQIMGHSTRTTLITEAPRLASFIATTNQPHLLHDRTGSRRFYCQRVENAISCAPINHAQVYAQLRAELDAGERTWFTKQEEIRIQQHNAPFYALTPIQELVLCHYRPTAPDETAVPLPSSKIYEYLQARHPRQMHGIRPLDFGKQLRPLFRSTSRRKDGRHYYAVAV